jgi:class 3 adenylate cyclase
MGGRAVTDPVGDLTLRGFSRPVSVFSVRGLDAAQVPT